ncbi:hypothetical protein LTR08_006153 [Meristemomyces frigidus]|nr:hypothetical protein LTR08_006153 [Meristemomyces frigidus]
MSEDNTQRIVDLMNDSENEVPYHIRLQSHFFHAQDLRWVILWKADRFLRSLPDDMELVGTPERNTMRDRQAKWTTIVGQPAMLHMIGAAMVKIMVVDVWLDCSE